jgi:hypothetical protein
LKEQYRYLLRISQLSQAIARQHPLLVRHHVAVNGNLSLSRNVQAENFSPLEAEQCIDRKAFKQQNAFSKGSGAANGGQIE